jgi:hypothetical protein
MAFIHGKDVVVTLDGVDLSAFANNVAFNRSADSHDTTTFGKDSHVFAGGLRNGTATITGIYDDGATGPEATIGPLIGTNVVLVYKPEGSVTGKPIRTVTVLVTGYDETAPVADMITWSCALQLSGDVVETVAP